MLGEFCTRLEAARGKHQDQERTIMNGEPVVLINAFEVPDGQDEAFLSAWERTRAFLSTQEEYLSTRLHPSLSPSAAFRFVNVARWESRRRSRRPSSSLSSGTPPSLSPLTRRCMRSCARTSDETHAATQSPA